MTARSLAVSLLALTLGLAVIAACGGDGGDGEQVLGELTNPDSVATATPWSEAPVPIILGPDVLTPIAPDDGGDGGTTVNVTPVAPFQVTTAESTNKRTEPSTTSGIAGTINAGQEATVTGQVAGETVEGSNNVWYELDDGSFVYSGAVDKVD
jgi:uncharacterized protein YgiM (DUF1202 family)